MSLLGDILLKVAEGRPLTGDERTSLRNLGNAAGNAGGLGHNIKPLTGNVSHLTAGGAVLETDGIKLVRGQIVAGRWENDGDFKTGNDLASAATTSLAVFSVAQTYNYELMGAGDLLLGDNSSLKANILWDASAGQILFRTGTTTEGYISTAGKAVFGGGNVVLDSGGITLSPGTLASTFVKWKDSDGQLLGYLQVQTSLGTPNRKGNFNLCAMIEPNTSGLSLSDATQAMAAISAIEGSSSYAYLKVGSGTNKGLEFFHIGATFDNFINTVFEARTSGTAAAGFGHKIFFDLEDAGGAGAATAAAMSVSWTDAAAATRTAAMLFLVANAGASAAERLRLGGTESVVNDLGSDVDFRIEGDTATNLLVLDAGLNAVQIGTTVAGAIADFRATSIVLNEAGADLDVRVEGTGTINGIYWDASANSLGIGRSDPTAITAGHILHLFNDISNRGASIAMTQYSGAAGTAPASSISASYIARGTVASPSAVQSGDVLGGLSFTGHDGSGFVTASRIRIFGYAAENWTGSNRGTYIAFDTTKIGTNTRAEALRIMDDGTLKLSNAASWTANGTAAVSLTNLGPAGIGTSTVGQWLTIVDSAGVTYYIPAWT